MSNISCALGFDLGLNSGFAIVRLEAKGAEPRVLATGNMDIRPEEGTSARLLLWHRQLAAVGKRALEMGAQGAAYEEIRWMRGQGARWILMQEGILNVALPEGLGIPVVPCDQNKLRAFAGMRASMRAKSRAEPRPPTWAKRSIDVFANPVALQSQDQAVAAFAAYWLCEKGVMR